MIMFNGYSNYNGSYSLVINNIRKYPDAIAQISCIIDRFSQSDQLFIGSYKTDGIYLSKNELLQYESDIVNHFENYGQFISIPPLDNRSNKILLSDLTVFRSFNKNETYKVLNKMFDFFLETIVFSPSVSFDEFKSSYCNYTKSVTYDYVLNGFTDFLFAYVDSGDFIINFDPKKYSLEWVEEQLDQFFDNSDLSI